jgi:hypothetical protein
MTLAKATETGNVLLEPGDGDLPKQSVVVELVPGGRHPSSRPAQGSTRSGCA